MAICEYYQNYISIFSNFILIQLNSLEQILSCRDGKCKLKSDKVSDEESNTDVDVANGDLIIHHVDVKVVQVVPDGGVVATWCLMQNNGPYSLSNWFFNNQSQYWNENHIEKTNAIFGY